MENDSRKLIYVYLKLYISIIDINGEQKDDSK